MSTWLQNDGLARKEIREGYAWQRWYCDRLVSLGINATCPDLSIRPEVAERHRYSDEGDIFVAGWTISIKSRRLRFWMAPQSYPYRSAFVATRSGWAKSNPKPCATVLISRMTRSALVVPTTTEELWDRQVRDDHVRNINGETFLSCPRNLLRAEWEFLDWLEVQQCRSTTTY